MKDIFNISKLIIKKKLKILSKDEKLDLKNFKEEYPFAKKIDFETVVNRMSSYSLIDKDKAWKSVLNKSEKKKIVPFVKSFNNWYKYGAAAALIIASSIYFFKSNLSVAIDKEETSKIVKTSIKPGTDKAILVLASGEEVSLGKGEHYNTKNTSSNGDEITYAKSSNKNELLYNYLIVPRGGTFTINLSDGTKVWLNSESKLKFPVAFVDGQLRQVELLYGEAYFEVDSSTKHKGSHFLVSHMEQKVEVLGTEFNIKAYQNESIVATTLVNGKVDVSYKNVHKKLIPSQQSDLDLTSNSFKISMVDVSRATAWKEGMFFFEDEPIDNILRTMSRWYNFDYKFLTESSKNTRFTGVIKKKKNLEEILNIISRTSNIKYSINSKNDINEVIITSK